MQILKYTIFLVLIMLVNSKTKCQELLNASVKQVKQYMKNQNSLLKSEGVTTDIFTNTEGMELRYQTPSASTDRPGIFARTFNFTSKGLCIHYTAWYNNGKYMPSLIAKFDDPKSGYKRAGKEFNWVSKSNRKILISIMPLRNANSQYNLFVLDVQEKTNYPPYKSDIIKNLEEAKKYLDAEDKRKADSAKANYKPEWLKRN